MRVFEDEKTDRFGNYPTMWIKGKDANPQKIHEELYRRYGGQGYKFAIVFDCSADEWEDPAEYVVRKYGIRGDADGQEDS